MFSQRPGEGYKFYAPDRDIAYCWKRLFTRSLDLIDAQIWPEWPALHEHIARESAGEFALALSKYMQIANDPSLEIVGEEAWRESGLQAAIDKDPGASILFFAALGRFTALACFISARTESVHDFVRDEHGREISNLFEMATVLARLDSEPRWLKWCRRNLPRPLYRWLGTKHRNRFLNLKRSHGEEKADPQVSGAGAASGPLPVG